ncbi:Asx homology domain-containing protein [Phyllosticta citricarpa]|uniref:Asx homology domain-containing protein n=1 Tax=Phyllosticta citricarpa TaxID=55181 RepID=A0ABR1LK58_9PEZI
MDQDQPASSPLSAAPDDFEDLDNEGFVAAYKHGGPVQSTDTTAAEQSIGPDPAFASGKRDTPSQTPSDVVDTVGPIEQGNNGAQEGGDHKSSSGSQAAPVELDEQVEQASVKTHVSDVDEHMKSQERPARKRKAPVKLEEHLKSCPPRPPRTKRKTDNDKIHSSAEDRPDVSSEVESPNNIAQRETPVMEMEKGTDTKAPRSRRQRKAPANYNESGSDAEFEAIAPAKSKKAANDGEKPKRGGITWTPDYLLQDSKSRLGKVNVTAILKDPRAWESLSKEQQSQLISLLPNGPTIDPQGTEGDSLPNIPQQMLASNSALLSDIAMFGEDLREGRLDPDWQRDGQIAMEMRARGDFDEWKIQEMESFWGQKQKLQHDVLAGESSKIKLEELVREGTVQVGDVWLYKRTFGRAKDSVVVEKEATVVSITDDHKLVFRFPPGTAKFSSPNAGDDIVTEPLSGPQQLGDAMIKEDGRISSYRNNNAWKEYRCIRNQNDFGSLWERREIYWAKKTEEPKSK